MNRLSSSFVLGLVSVLCVGACGGTDDPHCPHRSVGPGGATEVPLATLGGQVGVRSDLASEDARWLCDVDVTGVPVRFSFSSEYRHTRRTGCGLVTHAAPAPIWAREGVYASTGELVGAYRLDDVGSPLTGSACFDAAYVAGTWPAPECAEDVTWLCRPTSACPHALTDSVSSEPTLYLVVDGIGADMGLSSMDARYRCDRDPSSLPASPSWPDDYLAVRTEGCGVVSFELPLGAAWMRHVVYSTSTGEAVGASSDDDVPAANEGPSCADETVTVGTYPAPDCPGNVVKYCTSAW